MTGPVMITGFHRSGTSAVARAFHGAGLDLGTDLLGAEPANPYGHFEDEHAIAAHDSILATESLSWKSTSPLLDRAVASRTIRQYLESRSAEQSTLWGVKDPRLCLFLAEWVAEEPDAEIVFVVRPPGPAIASLLRRHARRFVDTDGIDPSDLAFWRDPDLGLKLWCHYHEQALPTLLAHTKTTVINYANAQESDRQIRHTISRLGLDGDAANPFDRSLGRDDTAWVHDLALRDRARSLWHSLEKLNS